MKKLTYILMAMFTLLSFVQCDDNTESLGSSIIPEQDKITAETKTFKAQSRTIMANDSILANTNVVYLGRYTDKESKTIFTSGFITQFACSEDYGFPDAGVIGDSAQYTKLRLYFEEYYGDSLNAMQCEVYELDSTLKEGIPYYTNLAPDDFYKPDQAPSAIKTYNCVDYSLHDTILNGENYSRHIEIILPNRIGNDFISKYYKKDSVGNHIGKKYFANSEVFIRDVFKGVYVKCTQGDGTVLKIHRARIDIGFNHYIESSTGKVDSIQSLSAPFYSGKEVLQVNNFDNDDLTPLADELEHTYLKTPAGLYTEVTLPIAEIVENCDTINSAKISFTRYNEPASDIRTPHPTLLMVRKCDMYKFFLKNNIADSKTSYITSFTSNTNEYTFSNIASLIKVCYKEYEEGVYGVDGVGGNANWEAENPDWNKVVLIPVSTTEDSNGAIVKLTHDISISSIRLRGGTEYEIPIEVITSKFND
ncbi:MAG: DUF4270 domain-containing protein [Bacteroidaceae bacterium]|nr:DUF4270 domain-containing protein [Bacteroidaceae bacterium]